MATSPDIKLAFVRQSLEDYNKRVVAEMGHAMQNLSVNTSYDLRRSLDSCTVNANAKLDGQFKVIFN